MAWSNQTLHERAREIHSAILTGGPMSRRAMLEFLEGVMDYCPNTLVVPPGDGHMYTSHRMTPSQCRVDLLDI